jgi:hypothetical protein
MMVLLEDYALEIVVCPEWHFLEEGQTKIIN